MLGGMKILLTQKRGIHEQNVRFGIDMAGQNASENPPEPIKSAMAEFSKAWISGQNIDIDNFCKSHPECGPELREHVEDYLFIATGF